MKKNTSVRLFILLCSLSVVAFSVYKYVHPSIQYPQSELLHAASLPAVSRTGNIQEEKFSEPVPFHTPGSETNVQVPPGHQSKASPTTLDTKQQRSSKLPYDTKTQAHGEHPPAQRQRLFLYLTQTEECLPQQLRKALGDPAVCQCDVAVLSYKENCTDSTLPHVRYIFNQSTTWTTGRNLLFYTFIHNTSDAYLYYIMIDDNLEVRWLKAGNKGERLRDSLHTFSRPLQDWQCSLQNTLKLGLMVVSLHFIIITPACLEVTFFADNIIIILKTNLYIHE